MRLDRYLSLKDLCTRRYAKKFMKENLVKVNEKVVKSNKYVVNYGDSIEINSIKYTHNQYYYYCINKPKGYICSNKDEDYPSILNLLNKQDFQTDLFCVGRLDVDTTGLLLITNDGSYSHELLNPKKHVTKKYLVTISNQLSVQDIDCLEKGVIITDDYLTKPAKVDVINKQKILLTISEGKYHQVKLMLNKVNNEVTDLHRTDFGKYNIGDIVESQYIEVAKL